MDGDQIEAYLEKAREIIGERSPSEIDYDDAVVRNLSAGMSIRKAIAAANKEHPNEALQPEVDHWEDLASRYEYLRQHKIILRKLGRSEL